MIEKITIELFLTSVLFSKKLERVKSLKIIHSSLEDWFTRDLPEYDDYMYLRGYSAQEVYTAFQKKKNRFLEERFNEKEEKKDAEDPWNAKINTEVYINGKRIK